jgi:hypothetical protein
MKYKFCSIALLATSLISVQFVRAQSPLTASRKSATPPNTLATGPGLPVQGAGGVGKLTKWVGFGSANSLIGDSNIFEDKLGSVGIGTSAPSSALTVVGMIETVLGGYKFPDGTVQTTAGLSSIHHDPSLTGTGTTASSLGIAGGGVQSVHLANGAITGVKIANGVVTRSINGLADNVMLQAGPNIAINPSGNVITISASSALTGVAHDSTLSGSGSALSPLGIAAPLSLTSATNPTLDISNSSNNGSAVNVSASNIGVSAIGGGVGVSGEGGFAGILADGSDGSAFQGGIGVHATGGNSNGGFGGDAVNAKGGDSVNDAGGNGINAVGGFSANPSFSGGHGIVAKGGIGVNGALDGLAALFFGNVRTVAVFGGNRGDLDVAGNLNVHGGTKNFKIDHPLDPANKYLYHAAIESSEVLNVYSGNVKLDANGEALVPLPEWFESINRDFRYSLTPIGVPAPGLFIAQEITDNRFKIAGGAPGSRVSWQVTGVRSDAVMLKHPFKVEEDKRANEKGYYLDPDAYDQPAEKSIDWPSNLQLTERLAHGERIKQQSHPRQQ